jgi:sugar phosphate isomerase/epimerase
MTKPIALQLYTLRDQLAQDFAGTVRKVADLGYAGVETAGQYGQSPAQARRLFDDLGLQVASAHLPLPLGPARDQVIETAQTLGCSRLVCAWLPPERFTSPASLRAVCAELTEASAAVRAHGLTLGYHNHWFEFDHLVDGRPAHDWMAEWLAPEIFFELDVYWVKTAGLDPAAVVRGLGERVPLVHLKDGPAQIEPPMTALGEGVLDLPAVVGAAGAAEWLIVELDRCATDMLAAVAKSFAYLAANGLGRGR